MKSILKYNWLIVLLVTTSLVVFAQTSQKKRGQYTTFYLNNGEKITAREGQLKVTIRHLDEFQLDLPSGKRSIKMKDISYSVFKFYSYTSGKLMRKSHSVYFQNGKDLMSLGAIIITDNYYLLSHRYASFVGEFILNSNNKEEYIILNKEKKVVCTIKNLEEAEDKIPLYFGELKNFIGFLNNQGWKLKRCNYDLLKVGAFLYANEYYKEEEINKDTGSNCDLKIIKEENAVNTIAE